jgi:hypothetical protein
MRHGSLQRSQGRSMKEHVMRSLVAARAPSPMAVIASLIGWDGAKSR